VSASKSVTASATRIAPCRSRVPSISTDAACAWGLVSCALIRSSPAFVSRFRRSSPRSDSSATNRGGARGFSARASVNVTVAFESSRTSAMRFRSRRIRARFSTVMSGDRNVSRLGATISFASSERRSESFRKGSGDQPPSASRWIWSRAPSKWIQLKRGFPISREEVRTPARIRSTRSPGWSSPSFHTETLRPSSRRPKPSARRASSIVTRDRITRERRSSASTRSVSDAIRGVSRNAAAAAQANTTMPATIRVVRDTVPPGKTAVCERDSGWGVADPASTRAALEACVRGAG